MLTYKNDKKIEMGHHKYTIDDELNIRDEQGEIIGLLWDGSIYIDNEEFFIDGDIVRNDLGTKEAFTLKKMIINGEEKEYNEEQGISLTINDNVDVNAEFELAKVTIKIYPRENVDNIIVEKISSQYGDINSPDYYVGDVIKVNVVPASEDYETAPLINTVGWENGRPYQIKRNGILPIEAKIWKKS